MASFRLFEFYTHVESAFDITHHRLNSLPMNKTLIKHVLCKTTNNMHTFLDDCLQQHA
jgi:hypothetical protein